MDWIFIAFVGLLVVALAVAIGLLIERNPDARGRSRGDRAAIARSSLGRAAPVGGGRTGGGPGQPSAGSEAARLAADADLDPGTGLPTLVRRLRDRLDASEPTASSCTWVVDVADQVPPCAAPGDDAGTDDRPEVQVRVRATEGGVELSVADHGVGIPASDQGRIFERFDKVDRVRVRGAGTGLGLSIARHVIEQHGGRISVESIEGHGSTFTVVLPVAPSPLADRGTAVATPS
jgi:hypothetical protein